MKPRDWLSEHGSDAARLMLSCMMDVPQMGLRGELRAKQGPTLQYAGEKILVITVRFVPVHIV